MNFLGNLKRLKKLLNGIIPQQKSRPRGWQSRRLAQFETLESRELLAVNVLGPVTAYAQPNNPAEIQFDLTTNGNTATKFDFTVQRSSGSTLDPAQLRLINRSNGQLVVLSDIANGTTSSSASAMLATGSYSIFVSADGGKGNFTFVISQDSPIKSGLDLLVMAAIAQQQQPGSWANRVAYYNGLLANTSYAGAASAIPIVKYYPEVDVNGDGKIDLTDNAIAKQNAGSASGSVNSYNVAKNDPVPETIQDSGNGNITVPSNHRVQSVAGQTLQAGQSKTLPSGQGTITLKTDGSLTFAPSSSFIQQLAHGETKTVSVPVVTQDIYGNEYSFAAEFTVTGQNELPTLKDSTPINLTFDQTAGSGTVKTSEMLAKWSDPDHGAKLSIINPVIQTASSSNVALNSKYTPASLKQYLSLTGTGITFTVSDSFFDELGLNETLTINVSYGVKDEYGQSLNTGTLNITVKGKDNPSVVTEKQTTFQINSNDMNNPVKPVNAGFSVTDPDRKDATGFVYSFSNVKDNSTTAVNGLITGFNTTNGTFNIDTSKLKNRSVNSVVTVDIFVKSASGGVVSKTLTINLTPLAIPVASPLVLTTTETNQQTGNVTPKVSGTAGFKTTGLTIVNASGYGTLPNGVSLSTAASLDENGNFVFTPGKNFEYLKQGETLKLKFQYAITDTQYGLTGIGTIDLTITGTASTPTGLNNQTIGDNGKFNATENNGTVSKITVSKSEILSGWTLPDGLEAYSIVAGTSSFEKWSGNDGNPLETDSLGSVNIDSSGNLVFWSDSQSYKKLGKGQWLDVAVPVFVRDASGAEYSIGKVLFRVYGANNAPKLNCTKNSFTFALNSTESVSINPGFTTNDPDLNDRTNWKFSIDQASTDCGFSIDATGIISISNDAKYKLDSGDYMINVTLSDNNGGTAAKDIKVHFFEESAPTIQNITISGTEDESSFGYNLNDAITISNTQNYSIEISELKQILLNENSYPNNLNGRYEVSFDSQTGDFIFTPQPNFFKFLTAGDTLSFQFEYTVSNNNYVNCQSTGLLIVNIIGVNDLPVQTSGQNQAIYDVTESKNAESITINNLLNGWNDADHDNNVLKISEVNIYGLEGNVLTLTELQNVELFTISENGRNLIFNPSHEIFRKL
ncbi:MAG: VCBS domain-containing protein, partial [Planctomycetaceae bacterium]|nr:VCBS domain-containing protein [Planctomycetaceae bacterium]